MSLRSDAPPVRAAFLTSSAAVPEIVPNHTTGTCDPNPFPLTITATNRGNILTESNVSATIELPPGLSFAGSEVPDAFRITSYNVCYTKLLRISCDDMKSSSRHGTGI